MGPLTTYATEGQFCECGCNDATAKDRNAGSKELACICLHGRGMHVLAEAREHGIDDNAGDRDVEPDRKGVAGDLPVQRETAGEGEKEGNEDHREGYH